MCERVKIEDIDYEYVFEHDIKEISDKALLERIGKTYEFLKLSEIYLSDVRDDYGKKKIARLRVDFVRHQLELLIRECFARGLKHGIDMSN